ncbi:MAG: hypothetical protein JJU34_17155 [Lunatimonas sp.]|uniref:hypothetical protein n=1 Tax=Lunatimonas sp. TaxID=2060141 RepID=UPI00263B0430|nr:hypothetical protein [Lunatimonas sp.]MCC5939010.1 hypothetical protein [Lunatimonas sp.]
MKHLAKIFFLLGLIPFVFLSCSNDDDGPQKTAEEIAIEALAGTSEQTWTISGGGSVSRDGTSLTNNYADFEIRFRNRGSAGLNYETTGSGGLFDPSGSWSLEGENYNRLRLSGIQPVANRDITYSKQGGDLRLEFTVPNPSSASARVEALVGFYVFTLKPKP